ncbi:MAG: hypothetical protein IJT50_16165 [Lentisphaeria bacterium]|nr:hypothetical protein [Lentisphaeria bacterium]
MQELTPKEYADLLNEEGELALEKMSDEQKLTLLLAKTVKASEGVAAAGTRCPFCKGSRFQRGTDFTCFHCGGKGWR